MSHVLLAALLVASATATAQTSRRRRRCPRAGRLRPPSPLPPPRPRPLPPRAGRSRRHPAPAAEGSATAPSELSPEMQASWSAAWRPPSRRCARRSARSSPPSRSSRTGSRSGRRRSASWSCSRMDGYFRVRPNLFYKFDLGKAQDRRALPPALGRRRTRRPAPTCACGWSPPSTSPKRCGSRRRSTCWTTCCWAPRRTNASADDGSQRLRHLLREPGRARARPSTRCKDSHRGAAGLRRGDHAGGHPALRPHGQPVGPGHAAQRRQLPGLRLRRHGGPRPVRHRAVRRLLRDAHAGLQRRGRHRQTPTATPAASRSTSPTRTTATAACWPSPAATRDQQVKAKLENNQGVLNYGVHFTYRTQRYAAEALPTPLDVEPGTARWDRASCRATPRSTCRTCGCATRSGCSASSSSSPPTCGGIGNRRARPLRRPTIPRRTRRCDVVPVRRRGARASTGCSTAS